MDKSPRIKLDGIKNKLLAPRHLILLETGDNVFVPLRVKRRQISYIIYNFVSEISSFLPLGPVSVTTATAEYQGFFAQHVTLALSDLTNLSDMLTANDNDNNIMQMFYGIAPSYVNVALEQPAGTYIDQLPESAMNPKAEFPWLYGHSGWDSPLYEPSEFANFYVVANLTTQFSLWNTAPIIVSPKMSFVINNMTVEPVTDVNTFKQMLLGQIPSEKTTIGQIYSNVGWSSKRYSDVKPVSARDVLDNNTSVLKSAGYS